MSLHCVKLGDMCTVTYNITYGLKCKCGCKYFFETPDLKEINTIDPEKCVIRLQPAPDAGFPFNTDGEKGPDCPNSPVTASILKNWLNRETKDTVCIYLVNPLANWTYTCAQDYVVAVVV